MTPQRPRYGDGKNKDWYSYTNSLDKCWQCTSCHHKTKTSPAADDRKAGRATHAPTSSATPSSADTGRKRPPQNAVASLADTGRNPHPRAGDSKAAPSKAKTSPAALNQLLTQPSKEEREPLYAQMIQQYL